MSHRGWLEAYPYAPPPTRPGARPSRSRAARAPALTKPISLPTGQKRKPCSKRWAACSALPQWMPAMRPAAPDRIGVLHHHETQDLLVGVLRVVGPGVVAGEVGSHATEAQRGVAAGPA